VDGAWEAVSVELRVWLPLAVRGGVAAFLREPKALMVLWQEEGKEVSAVSCCLAMRGAGILLEWARALAPVKPRTEWKEPGRQEAGIVLRVLSLVWAMRLQEMLRRELAKRLRWERGDESSVGLEPLEQAVEVAEEVSVLA
jgi:hypothetical protein